MKLELCTWQDVIVDAVVLQLRDDQTPTKEKRFAQVLIPHDILVRAWSPKIVFENHLTLLVKTFNEMAGKKVKIVRTVEEMDKDRVPRIMLPYHLGLEYYDA